MKRILLTNDDSFRCSGFYPLLKELQKDFAVTSVAPDSERSWIGKSITAKTDIKVKKVNLNGTSIFACSGTPADCSQLGIFELSKKKPDLVVSGINIGANTGHGRILSSGTIGAAMEGAIEGIKAVASSIHIPSEMKQNTDLFSKKNYHLFTNAAKITAKITKIAASEPFPAYVDIISINIPLKATLNNEFQITKPHRVSYGKLFQKKGNAFIPSHPKLIMEKAGRGTDLTALAEEKVSITPISLDLSREESFKKVNQLFKKNW